MMQLRLEQCDQQQNGFENVFGMNMSGMPEHTHIGATNDQEQQQQQLGQDNNMRSYLMMDEKGGSTSLKRPSDHHQQDQMAEASNKRSKSASDYNAAQQGLAHLPHNSQQGNMFHSELQRAQQAFAQQQAADQFNVMNNAGLGGISAAHMDRRLEEEVARQQAQQSAMLANEMARRNQQMNSMNSNMNMNQFGSSNDQVGFGAAGCVSQRQQGLYDNNADFMNNANMQDLQNMQGFSQLSSMGAPPLLSGMLDFSLLNNRMAQQGLGGFSGNALPSGNSASMNQAQMVAMSQASQQMGQLQGNTNQGSSQVNPMSPLSAAEVMQFSRMNASSAPSPRQSLSMTPGQADVFSPQRQMPHLPQLEGAGLPPIPPLEEAQTLHFTQRPYSPFSIDEDPNWLSSFQCFIRSEILELFRVSHQGIKVRNALKSLTVNQVGIRCRFCAHLQHGTRANRASCFPSKIDKIYQSFTMMLREHFPSCSEIPDATKKRFTQLQNMNAQGASNAKGFWEHAAKKKGLVDISEDNGRGGIHIFEATIANSAVIAPFGSTPSFSEPQPPVTLVYKVDKGLVSNFLYALMEKTYRVHLAPSERKGNRKSLRPGMPGFGCRYCYEAGRMGLSRLFPARRRTIHTKVPDLFDHMKRCPLCPQQAKNNLMRLHNEDNGGITGPEQDTATRGREREFFERVWTRLGHQEDSE